MNQAAGSLESVLNIELAIHFDARRNRRLADDEIVADRATEPRNVAFERTQLIAGAAAARDLIIEIARGPDREILAERFRNRSFDMELRAGAIVYYRI